VEAERLLRTFQAELCLHSKLYKLCIEAAVVTNAGRNDGDAFSEKAPPRG
jgi:hypothetical protein